MRVNSDDGFESKPANQSVRVTRAVRTLLAVALIASGSWSCASTHAPRKACLSLQPAETLNLYDGQPHALTVFIYPLSSVEGFEQTRPDDLLAGARPAGVLAPPVPITVEPSELERSFQELFPSQTTHLGVIADYYRAPGDPEGERSRVVPARCGIFKPKIELASRDLLPE